MDEYETSKILNGGKVWQQLQRIHCFFDNNLIVIQRGQGTLYKYELTFIHGWINTYVRHKVYDENTYPFSNFNGAAVEVW